MTFERSAVPAVGKQDGTLVQHANAAEFGIVRVKQPEKLQPINDPSVYMKNIKLIAIIAGATVLASVPALILPVIFRAPKWRLSRPNSTRKSRKTPSSKTAMAVFRRPHAVPA